MMDEEDRMMKSASSTVPAAQRRQHRDQVPEVPSPCPQPMPAVYECSPYFKSGIHDIDGEAANNTLEEDDELKDDQLDNDPDDEAKAEDDALTICCEVQHRSQGVIVHCGWATHGIF
jgi:hypothetical protein